uniref:Uncharacterized protein n=1 Tax=Oreochromis niloticus TaxID=8128 RepID=A0A669E002_ORENI
VSVTTLAIAAVQVTAVISTPIVLGAVGFISAGIATAVAVANGGMAAGSAVAVLHSAGMAGLSGTATAAVGSVGGAIGGFLAALI